MSRFPKGLLSLLIFISVFFLPLCDNKSVLWAAGIKTSEEFSSVALLEKQIVEMAKSSQLSTGDLQKDLAKVAILMEQSDPEKFSESLQSIETARNSLKKAQETSRALSDYVAANRNYMSSSLSRFIPLADLDHKVENPYYMALGKFLDLCNNLLSYSVKHFSAISTGKQPERNEYEELFNAYLFGLADFNNQAGNHTQLLNEWSKLYNDIRAYLPN